MRCRHERSRLLVVMDRLRSGLRTQEKPTRPTAEILRRWPLAEPRQNSLLVNMAASCPDGKETSRGSFTSGCHPLLGPLKHSAAWRLARITG